MNLTNREPYLSRFFMLILCIFLFPATYSHADIKKHSIQLGRSIENVAICGDQALVKIKKNPRTSSLISIDLKTLNTQQISIVNADTKFSCDESNGSYYISNLIDEKNPKQTGIYAYKKIGDAQPIWKYLIDEKYYPVITSIVNSEKTVVINVNYIRDKAPTNSPNIFVFDKETGKVLWQFSLYPISPHELSVINNRLYITSDKSTIQAYNLETLSQSWEIVRDFRSGYVKPTLDKNTNTLITGVRYGDDYHHYAEIIGIHPETGETKWRIFETPMLYFPNCNESSQLIYMQFDKIYNINWYNLQGKQPAIQYQWRNKYQSIPGSPDEIHIIGNHVLVTFYANGDNQYAYLFDDHGNQIDEVKFEDQEFISVTHSNISKHTIYTAANGEFGTLDFDNEQ